MQSGAPFTDQGAVAALMLHLERQVRISDWLLTDHVLHNLLPKSDDPAPTLLSPAPPSASSNG